MSVRMNARYVMSNTMPAMAKAPAIAAKMVLSPSSLLGHAGEEHAKSSGGGGAGIHEPDAGRTELRRHNLALGRRVVGRPDASDEGEGRHRHGDYNEAGPRQNNNRNGAAIR